MQKQCILLIFLSTLSALSLNIFADSRAEFTQWMNQEDSSFQEYKDKRDKDFSHFLNHQWKEMQTFQGLVRDTTPKPIRMLRAPKSPELIPALSPSDSQQPTTQLPDKTTTPVIIKKTISIPATPPLNNISNTGINYSKEHKINLNFYGQNLIFYFDPKLKLSLQRPINEKSVSHIWSEMSKADYSGLINQINAQRKPLILNDWGYALLINTVAQKIHPGSKNDQSIFAWYLMTKAGYQARIAYDSNYVYLLMATQQKLFGLPYFTFDKTRYYALSFDGIKQKPGKIFTYDGHYPGAKKSLDMSLGHAFNTGRKQKFRHLNFTYNGQKHLIKVSYDNETIRYLKTYPQMDIGLYFNADLSSETANPLLKQLKALVEGKSEKEAINLILRFVQTAFKYKTDEQQFGIENYLFPEETLHYPYSDCEDRAIFFAWVVHNLLELKVIGLDYPGHISAAVLFNKHVQGDSVNFNGKHYVITDPTYINANVGMTMPIYKSQKPAVIRVLN